MGKNKIEVRVKVYYLLWIKKLKSIFDKNIFATNIVFKVPTPKNTAGVNSNTAIGRAKYEPD